MPSTSNEKYSQILIQIKNNKEKEIVEKELGIILDYRYFVSNRVYAIRIQPSKISKLKDLLSTSDKENLSTSILNLVKSFFSSIPSSSSIPWINHFHPKFKTNLKLENSPEYLKTLLKSPSIKLEDLKSMLGKENFYTVQTVLDRITLNVVVIPANDETSALIAKNWNKYLQNKFGSENILVEAISEVKINVYLSSSIAGSVQEFLQEQEETHWIERSFLFKKPKNYYAHGITQSGSSNPLNNPIWENGITGEGQIIGVGDTGIDYDNCFFNDPNFNDIPLNTINNDYRKIISYNTISLTINGQSYTTDQKDMVDGHGTHVVGSIAGEILQSNQNYTDLHRFNGVAPSSKIYFTDIQVEDFPGLIVPNDFNIYFSPAYAAGSRIHSNSWGFDISSLFRCKFDCNCYWGINFDKFSIGDPASNIWCNNNFGRDCCRFFNRYDTQTAEVDLFMQKNQDFLILFASGNEGHYSSYGSVISPATCKNCISVGASTTTTDNLLLSLNYSDYSSILYYFNFNSTEECCSYVNSDPSKEEFVKRNCCPESISQLYIQNTLLYNMTSIPLFSARGPTTDGRFKPDIVAPGYNIQSMHSDGNITSFQCSTESPSGDNRAAILSQTGTSMSTPIVAGSAALVRQYFIDGFYPYGYANESSSLYPSASLVKAVILHSAQPLTGVTQTGDGKIKSIPTTYPNIYAGYGMMVLNSVLKFNDSNFDLFVQDSDGLENTEEDRYCFQISKDGGFRATLVWTDVPGNPVSSTDLVNDLNLQIREGFFSYNGNGNKDSTNNVEQITLNNAKIGQKYYLYVTGSNIQVGPQSYSIVITGNFNMNCKVPSIVLDWKELSLIFGSIALVFLVFLISLTILVIIRIKRRKSNNQQSSTNGPAPKPPQVTRTLNNNQYDLL